MRRIIPKLAGYTQVLATSHESIAFASFGGGRNTGRVKILVFTSSYGYEPTRMAR